MGQKANPIGLRLGYIRGWESMWYGEKDFAEKLMEDVRIRNYIGARIQKGGISKIVIERTLKRVTVTIHTSRPGIVIGKGGTEVDKLREELKNITKKDIQINIYEIKRPELDAKLVAENIASQLQARISFRRALKMAIASTMRMGAEGIKVRCSGRLGGAEMARSEGYKEGRTPLHTFRADVDYALAEAQTVYGKIGVKVWICKGEVFGKRDLSLNFGMSKDKDGPGGGDRQPRRMGGDNRGGGGGDRRERGGGGDRGGDNRGGGGDRGPRGDNRGGGGGGRGPGGPGGNRGGGGSVNRGGGAPGNNNRGR
jgi:small subunit ribosomal protein S3